jgi:hypothetical protein
MKYAEFKQKCIERTDENGYIKEGYVLCVDGYVVNYMFIATDKNNDEYVAIDFLAATHFGIEIYQFEVDENNEYNIEWFVLEKEA